MIMSIVLQVIIVKRKITCIEKYQMSRDEIRLLNGAVNTTKADVAVLSQIGRRMVGNCTGTI